MYELSNEDVKINYMPETIIEEILQNGRTILHLESLVTRGTP